MWCWSDCYSKPRGCIIHGDHVEKIIIAPILGFVGEVIVGHAVRPGEINTLNSTNQYIPRTPPEEPATLATAERIGVMFSPSMPLYILNPL